MNILQFDKLHCKNCYKCVRHCPVKAIEVKNHRAQINAADCILCGECTIICPQKTKGAVSEVDQLQEALRRLRFRRCRAWRTSTTSPKASLR